MKVILNIETIRFPLTGIGRYTYELANALQNADDIESLHFLSMGRFVSKLPQASSADGAGYRLKQIIQKSPVLMQAYQRLAPLLRARALKGQEDSIYHSPNFFLPKFSGKRIATFHDLSAFTWEQFHDPAKIQYLQQAMNETLRVADMLITDSDFNKTELARFSGIPLSRIQSVPLAAGPEFHPRTDDELQPLLQRLNLFYQGYTLYIGTIEPRKNLIALLNAYHALPIMVRRQWPLVLAGYKGWSSEAIHASIKKAEQEGWARYLGYLSVEDLPLLYAGARLFAFPSHYEGFGLPVLEAMSSGVPVVCSNSSSLPEVTGKAALMCDPNDVEKLSENLLRGLEDNLWRHQAVTKGLLNAAQFSWTRCADETLNTYRKLMSS